MTGGRLHNCRDRLLIITYDTDKYFNLHTTYFSPNLGRVRHEETLAGYPKNACGESRIPECGLRSRVRHLVH